MLSSGVDKSVSLVLHEAGVCYFIQIVKALNYLKTEHQVIHRGEYTWRFIGLRKLLIWRFTGTSFKLSSFQ